MRAACKPGCIGGKGWSTWSVRSRPFAGFTPLARSSGRFGSCTSVYDYSSPGPPLPPRSTGRWAQDVVTRTLGLQSCSPLLSKA
eukprot:15459070-Alexandrium_andersonii.AAC.1